jgi:hypothetical protein
MSQSTSTVSISRPCDVVVSAHASPSGPECAVAVGNGGEGVQQVAGGSRQPVQPRRHQHVAGAELVDHATNPIQQMPGLNS